MLLGCNGLLDLFENGGGCELLREGPTIPSEPRCGQDLSRTRRTDINDYLARKICRDLGIPAP